MPARPVGMIRGMSTPACPLHVMVAGGGVAGLEALMALRDLAGDRVRLTLLTPEEHFTYRPMAVAAPFARGRARRIALDEVLAPLSVQRRRTSRRRKGIISGSIGCCRAAPAR